MIKFIGKKWTLETESKNGFIMGYITNAISATTNQFYLSNGTISRYESDIGEWCGAPAYVQKELATMMKNLVP